MVEVKHFFHVETAKGKYRKNMIYFIYDSVINLNRLQLTTFYFLDMLQAFIGNQGTCLKVLPQQIQTIVNLAAEHQEKAPEFLDLLQVRR